MSNVNKGASNLSVLCIELKNLHKENLGVAAFNFKRGNNLLTFVKEHTGKLTLRLSWLVLHWHIKKWLSSFTTSSTHLSSDPV